jgi:phosphoribosylaminoimidazole (AIR) synthetase
MIWEINSSGGFGSVVGAAHITGGGLNENIDRNLRKGLKSMINENAWEVPDIFRWVQRESGISEVELRRTFNCGIGMALIIDKDCECDLSKFEELIEIGEVIEE